MKEKEFVIKNKHGLHLRPATELIKIIGNFDGDIVIIKGDIEVNGKSILGILSLAIDYNDKIKVRVNGAKEDELLQALSDFFNKEE